MRLLDDFAWGTLLLVCVCVAGMCVSVVFPQVGVVVGLVVEFGGEEGEGGI